MPCGTYVENAGGAQTIALSFTPKVVYALSRASSDIESYSSLALTGDPYKVNIWESIALEIVPGDFAASSIVSGSTQYFTSLNSAGQSYLYLAWG